MQKQELKEKVIETLNDSNKAYWDKYPDGRSYDDLPKDEQEAITKGNEKLADDLIELITKNGSNE